MRYKILLFDLDDTLLDFKANENDSLTKLFQQNKHDFSEDIFKIYDLINKQLWADYENGKIELEQLLNTRFSETMLKIGKVVDGAKWEREYRELLANGTQLIDGAFELCEKLSLTHRLFIVTNGVHETQIRRLKQSGLYDFFEDIFASQSVGFQKPAKEFFNYVKNNIEDFNKKDALIIGDSLNTDIKGGNLSKIDTCWLNRNQQKESCEIKSTYTIKCLSELYDICI